MLIQKRPSILGSGDAEPTGGNRVLMALIQLVAAALSEVDVLVFHAHTAAGVAECRRAQSLFRESFVHGGELQEEQLIQCIEALRFQWGTGDGN